MISRNHHSTGGDSRAEHPATQDALGAVEKTLEAVLSYDTGNLAAHRATVRQHLTPSMQRDIKQILPDLNRAAGNSRD